MIEAFNPTHLTIIVSEWEDYISSFWYIDWIQLHEQFAAINGKLYIARVKNEDELLAEVIHSSILLLDGTYCYKAPGLSNQLDEYSKILWSIRPDSIFTYLGYTVDEYNMVLNTVETLKKEPRILRQSPNSCLTKPFIVCGSGPSLDTSIKKLHELKSSHYIVCGGSNYKTLLDNNIEPDFLALVERSDETYSDYKKVFDIHGQTKTVLFMSSTCPSELVDLFVDTVVFYRPALTPLSIFSSNFNEVLSFEGPESVNTATAVALSLGATSIAFIGVDLGTNDVNKDRSSNATGASSKKLESYERVTSNKLYSPTKISKILHLIESAIKTYPSVEFITAAMVFLLMVRPLLRLTNIRIYLRLKLRIKIQMSEI